MKLGKRLQKIKEMAIPLNSGVDEIWDCCCDHGHLGFTLLKETQKTKIHFVDVVPALIDQVEQDLQQFYSGDPNRWAVHCVDVAQLPFEPSKANKQLIIITGIGGELMIELLQPLFKKLSHKSEFEFLLSPVHHNFNLRCFLIENNALVIDEQLVFENKRGYEVLHISFHRGDKLSSVGSSMWDFEQKQHHDYLDKKNQHYQRKGLSNAVDAYLALANKGRIIN